jgi:hypothetical protein
LELLRGWLGGVLEGKSFLRGYEEDTWNERFDEDMVTLATSQRGLSRATASGMVKLYDLVYGHRSKVMILRRSITRIKTDKLRKSSEQRLLTPKPIRDITLMTVWTSLRRFSPQCWLPCSLES